MRNERKKAVDQVKKLKKDVSEDAVKLNTDEIQQITNDFTEQVSAMLDEKRNQILEWFTHNGENLTAGCMFWTVSDIPTTSLHRNWDLRSPEIGALHTLALAL